MSLFEIDYLKKTWLLMKEAFKFKKYKTMHPAFAVFVGILMLPFVAISFALTAVLTVFCFVFNLLLTPVKHFHSIVHAEGQSVKAGAQFWIYFITWIILFVFYLVFSFLPIVIYLLYIILVISTYIFSLGGFKFHIYPNADSDDIAIETDTSKGKFFVIPIACISTLGVLAIVTLIFALIFITGEDDFLLLTAVMSAIYAVTAGIYSFVVFAPRYVKKGDAVEEAADAPEIEEVATVVVEAAPVVEATPVVEAVVTEAPATDDETTED